MIAEALEDNTRKFLTELARAADPTKFGIHSVRVRIRKLLALLDLVAATNIHIRRRTRRRLRRLLFLLSPLRDTQVQIEALKATGGQQRVVRRLLKMLRPRRKQLARVAAKRIEKFDAKTLTLDVDLLRASLGIVAQDPAATEAMQSVFIGVARDHYSKLERRSLRSAGKGPRAIHRMRLALKDYRYTAMALRDLIPGATSSRLAAMGRLQDSLGAIHDAQVLAETVNDWAKSNSLDAARNVHPLQRRLAKNCRQMRARFVEDAIAPVEWAGVGSPQL